MNVLFRHRAIAALNLVGEIHEEAFKIAEVLLKNKNPDAFSEYYDYLLELKEFSKIRKKNVFDYIQRYEFEFNYDVIEWLKSVDELSLDHFLLPKATKISFQLSDKQFKSVQKTLEMYGETIVGKSKALRMISSTNLWRRPVIEKSMKSLGRQLTSSSDRTVMEIWDDQSSMRLNQSNEN